MQLVKLFLAAIARLSWKYTHEPHQQIKEAEPRGELSLGQLAESSCLKGGRIPSYPLLFLFLPSSPSCICFEGIMEDVKPFSTTVQSSSFLLSIGWQQPGSQPACAHVGSPSLSVPLRAIHTMHNASGAEPFPGLDIIRL